MTLRKMKLVSQPALSRPASVSALGVVMREGSEGGRGARNINRRKSSVFSSVSARAMWRNMERKVCAQTVCTYLRTYNMQTSILLTCACIHTITVYVHKHHTYTVCAVGVRTYVCMYVHGGRGTHTLSAMCTCGVHHIHPTFLHCARSATSSAGVRRWQGWRRTWTGASRGGRSCSGRWKRQW